MQVLRPLPQGESADLVVGQKVYAIGNPFGLDHSLTTGVISGMQREISSGINGRPIQGVVQIDAAINRAPHPLGPSCLATEPYGVCFPNRIALCDRVRCRRFLALASQWLMGSGGPCSRQLGGPAPG